VLLGCSALGSLSVLGELARLGFLRLVQLALERTLLLVERLERGTELGVDLGWNMVARHAEHVDESRSTLEPDERLFDGFERRHAGAPGLQVADLEVELEHGDFVEPLRRERNKFVLPARGWPGWN